MLEFTELLKATHSFTNIGRLSLHVAMEVIQTPEFNDLDRRVNMFCKTVSE